MQQDTSQPPTYGDVISSTRYPLLRTTSQPEVVDQRLLKFADFTPHIPSSIHQGRTSDTEDLVDRLNQWVHENKTLRVVSVETVSWNANSLTELNKTDTSFTHTSPSISKTVHCMRGVRLWFTAHNGSRDHSISLGVRDIDLDPWGKDKVNWVSLKKQINEKLLQDKIPGCILSVETLTRSTKPNIPMSTTYWTENSSIKRHYRFFIRVFYVVGQPCSEEIGIKDFYPRTVSRSRIEESGNRFVEVLSRANDWILQRPNLHITNVQSVLVPVKSRKFSFEDILKLTYSLKPNQQLLWLQYFRVYFTYHAAYTLRMTRPSCIIKKTFPPRRLPASLGDIEVKFEPFSSVADRVAEWLHQQRADVLNLTTVSMEVDEDASVSPEDVFVNGEKDGRKRRKYVLTYIRLYLRGDLLNPVNRGQAHYVENPYYIDRRQPNKRLIHCKRCCFVTLFLIMLVIAICGLLYIFKYKTEVDTFLYGTQSKITQSVELVNATEPYR